jgi:uncharacterized membrane protein
MKTGKLVLYAVAGLVTLVAAAFVVQTVLWAVSLLITVLRLLALLAVLGGLGYVGYKLYSLVSGISGSSSNNTDTNASGEFSMTDIGTTTDTATGSSSSDSLREQYLNGEITEAEFERRLEREIDTGEYDGIDRELQRERS